MFQGLPRRLLALLLLRCTIIGIAGCETPLGPPGEEPPEELGDRYGAMESLASIDNTLESTRRDFEDGKITKEQVIGIVGEVEDLFQGILLEDLPSFWGESFNTWRQLANKVLEELNTDGWGEYDKNNIDMALSLIIQWKQYFEKHVTGEL